MSAIDRWASTRRPYARTALLAVGFGLYVPATTLTNWLLWFSRDGLQPATGQPPTHGAVGVGLLVTAVALGTLLLAGGLVCLGGAIPGGAGRPGLALPAGRFDETQRQLLGSAGVAMLGTILGIPLLGLLLAVVLPVLAFALAWYVVPLVSTLGYLLVLGALVVPLDSRRRAVAWIPSVVIGTILVVAAGAVCTWFVEGDLSMLGTIAAGLPAITVLAGYVARTPVVTYFSRD